MIRAGAFALALAASAAAAQEAVEAPGQLGDEDFYRLVACAAPPGGDCVRPFLRWQTERPVRVALRRIDPAFLGRPKQRAEAALTRALQALNDTEAGFRLARVGPGDPAEIELYFLDFAAGDTIEGTGIAGLDGFAIGEVSTRMAVDADRNLIGGAMLVVSTSLVTPAYESALLSTLARAMGLMTAVAGPAYAGTSVLSTIPGGLTRLGPQDVAALRRHYAPPAR